MDIEIDEQLSDALKPLSDEERAGLKAMIEADGRIVSPLIVWDTAEGRTLLIDGHHRHEIAGELGIGFQTVKMKFASRKEAVKWIKLHQANRRNVTKGEASILRGERAIKQRREKGEHLKNREKPNENEKGRFVPIADDGKKTLSEIAKDEGVDTRQLKRDIVRTEVRNEAAKADQSAAKAIVEMPQSDVEEIKRAAEKKTSDNPESKPAVIVEEVKRRTAAPRPEPVRIDGACDELCQLVQSGTISKHVAENLIEQVPGQLAQAKIVAKGADAVKKAASKPRAEKVKEPPKVTEAQVTAFLQNADVAVRARVIGKVFTASEPDERSAIMKPVQRSFTETEKFRLVSWAREQESNMESEMTAKEIKIVSARAKFPLNHKHRVTLVKKLIDNPHPELFSSLRKWAHDNLVGKQALFVPPTADEVKAYAATLDRSKYPDATQEHRIDKFIDYHESNGWTYGKDKKKVSSWQARYRDSLKWEVSGSAGQDVKTPVQIARKREQDKELAERKRKIEANEKARGGATKKRTSILGQG